ncbi:microfibril-associated glycoprotein 4-like [Styela clava]
MIRNTATFLVIIFIVPFAICQWKNAALGDDSSHITFTALKDQITLMLHLVVDLEKVIIESKERNNATNQLEISIIHSNGDVFNDCNEIFNKGYTQSGVYMIQIFHGFYQMPIFCDMQLPGVFSGKRGWMTIQTRMNGEVNFDRSWNDYLHGFGFPDREHWIGLRNILRITKQKRVGKFGIRNLAFRIDVEDWDGVTGFMEHSDFSMLSEEFDFEISDLGQFSGTRGLGSHLGFNAHKPFSTYDHNNDRRRNEACVKSQRGGWWYGFCSHTNLNGVYSARREKMTEEKIFIRNWGNVNPRNTAFRYVSIKLQ